MGLRSDYLWDISQLLNDRFGDVEALRKARPDIAAAFPRLDRLSDLEALIEHLKSGVPVPPPPPKRSRGNRTGKRKATLTDAEMLRLKEEGQTLAAIGRLAGVSRQAVNEAIQKEKLRLGTNGNA